MGLTRMFHRSSWWRFICYSLFSWSTPPPSSKNQRWRISMHQTLTMQSHEAAMVKTVYWLAANSGLLLFGLVPRLVHPLHLTGFNIARRMVLLVVIPEVHPPVTWKHWCRDPCPLVEDTPPAWIPCQWLISANPTYSQAKSQTILNQVTSYWRNSHIRAVLDSKFYIQLVADGMQCYAWAYLQISSTLVIMSVIGAYILELLLHTDQ